MSRRLFAAATCAGVVFAAVTAYDVVGNPAVAVAQVEAPIGLGTVSPGSGGLATDLQLNVSRGCPSSATGFDVRFSGGSIDGAVVVNDYTPLADVLAAPGQSDPMTVPLAANLDTARAFAGVDQLDAGVYSFTFRCRTQASDASLGDFVGALTVVSTLADVSGWTRATFPSIATLTSVTGPDTLGYGESATFHVNVKSYREIPVGTVQLFADGRPISASRVLSGGAADIVIDAMPVGAHSVTARYRPSRSDFLPSSSDSLVSSVVPGTTTLQLAAHSSGHTVTLTAIVDPPVDGVVTFSGPFPGGSRPVRVIVGHASFVVSAPATAAFTARFSPSDPGFAGAAADVSTRAGMPRAATTVPAPVARAGTSRDGTVTAAGPPIRQAATGATPSSPPVPSTPAPAVAPGPATASPAGSTHGSAATLDPHLEAGGVGNPGTDGALTISVQGIVSGTASGIASTSYGVDAPIGGATAGDTVVVLAGQLDSSATFLAMSGSMVPVVIRDTRANYPGYEVTGSISDLADNAGHVISSRALGWTPEFISSTAFPSARDATDAGLIDGTVVAPADALRPEADGTVGLGVGRALFVSPPGVWAGTVTYGAVLVMHAPTATPPGDYHATLTLTVTGAVL